MNCDRIAPFYQVLERTAFSQRLQNHRIAFIDAANAKQRALILGDGDGRFAEALAIAYPCLEIHFIEKSAGMIAQASKRLKSHGNVRLLTGDALRFEFQPNIYDILFTHFFLDCFDTGQVQKLAARISNALTPDATWIITDFQQAPSGWRWLYTSLWLNAMYLFFRVATGLSTSSLPDYAAVLHASNFQLTKRQLSLTGLIASEWWQRYG